MEPLFSFSIDRALQVTIEIDLWLLIIGGIAVGLIYLMVRRWIGRGGLFIKDVVIDEGKLGIGTGSFSLKVDRTDRQIAYKLWVELSTRKIGLPIDVEYDVINEVYNSWYAFFGIARNLIKEIPVSKISRDHTKSISDLSIDVLNRGMRPHLTKWQARFRHWFSQETQKQPDQTPQHLQRQFPEYEELLSDLVQVNERLIEYRNKMRELVGS